MIKEDSKLQVFCLIVIAEVPLLITTLMEVQTIIKDVLLKPMAQEEANTIVSPTFIQPKILEKELDH